MAPETYGVTSDGREIDDVMVNKLAAEAERGYFLAELADKPRGKGRPPVADRAEAATLIRPDETSDSRPLMRDEEHE